MISNDERREVAARLRNYENLRESFRESPICAFLDALVGDEYLDWKGICNRLADLIEPEPEPELDYKKMYEDRLNDEHAQKEELKKEVSELKEELAECRKQIMTLTNFVLASAIKRADGEENLEEIRNIIK